MSYASIQDRIGQDKIGIVVIDAIRILNMGQGHAHLDMICAPT
jgi:hypothetical protein